MSIKLGNKTVGPGFRPIVVAELSCNHGGSLDAALQLVEAAHEAGADAVKTQTYTADSLVDTSSPLWGMYDRAAMPWHWNEKIFARAKELGMLAFSSVFCKDGVEYLESIDCPCYKIASFENNHLELIEKVAITGKPVIISTGMATEQEIHKAVHACWNLDNDEVILTHCNSSYPADLKDANVETMCNFPAMVDCGYSDHCKSNIPAIVAAARGAVLIEKHFTLSYDNNTLDKNFSLNPADFADLCKSVREAYESLGEVKFGCKSEAEEESSKYRRKLINGKWLRDGGYDDEEECVKLSPTEVVNKIEKIRGKNNRNWMDLLRLALKENPEEAKEIIKEVYKHDEEISKLVKEII